MMLLYEGCFRPNHFSKKYFVLLPDLMSRFISLSLDAFPSCKTKKLLHDKLSTYCFCFPSLFKQNIGITYVISCSDVIWDPGTFWKLFLVDCLLWKTLNMAKLSITERTKAFYAHENYECNHSRKYNCDEVSEWRHSRVSSTSYPYLGMVLVMSRG